MRQAAICWPSNFACSNNSINKYYWQSLTKSYNSLYLLCPSHELGGYGGLILESVYLLCPSHELGWYGGLILESVYLLCPYHELGGYGGARTRICLPALSPS